MKDKIFGTGSDKSDVTAATLINLPKTTMVQDINMGKSEQIYKTVQREPLGKPYSRNYVLPEECGEMKYDIYFMILWEHVF